MGKEEEEFVISQTYRYCSHLYCERKGNFADSKIWLPVGVILYIHVKRFHFIFNRASHVCHQSFIVCWFKGTHLLDDILLPVLTV